MAILEKAILVKFFKLFTVAVFISATSVAFAERINNEIAVFSALEKVTAIIQTIEIPINETKKFGVFEVTPRVCYSRSATERPQTTSFIEIDEISTDETERKRIFTGWMFASSPGLHAVEHPVYDIWLIDCKRAATE
ncbi:MAG: glycosyl hydrolase family 5 [Hyphomicrobiales bacterium]|nr:MAG: glycosyl hydrolase family 5 [Hyphomicrobiales bacterium]